MDLVEKVIRVSMKTHDIVDSLLALEELPQTANWPATWNYMVGVIPAKMNHTHRWFGLIRVEGRAELVVSPADYCLPDSS